MTVQSIVVVSPFPPFLHNTHAFPVVPRTISEVEHAHATENFEFRVRIEGLKLKREFHEFMKMGFLTSKIILTPIVFVLTDSRTSQQGIQNMQ
jgi:hypothetical protein